MNYESEMNRAKMMEGLYPARAGYWADYKKGLTDYFGSKKSTQMESLGYRDGLRALLKDPKPEDIKKLLKDHQITQGTAAKMVGVSDRTFRRWIAGKIPIPYAAWELLKYEVINEMDITIGSSNDDKPSGNKER